MRLALRRRNARPPDADPLPPIRSLHYFLAVIDELPAGPPPDGYLDYLRETALDLPPASPTITSPGNRRNDPAPNPGAGPKNDGSS